MTLLGLTGTHEHPCHLRKTGGGRLLHHEVRKPFYSYQYFLRSPLIPPLLLSLFFSNISTKFKIVSRRSGPGEWRPEVGVMTGDDGDPGAGISGDSRSSVSCCVDMGPWVGAIVEEFMPLVVCKGKLKAKTR